MPSLHHEALIMLFRNRPTLAAELLKDALKIDIPDYHEARIQSEDLTEWNPAEYHADAVIVFGDGAPVLAVVVEVQRAKDQGKRWSWPVYLAGLRARTRCPAILLVVCPDPIVGEWCSQSIDLGHPDWRLKPLVLMPEAIPAVTDLAEATAAPELAVLSAMAHGADREGRSVLHAMLAGVATLDTEKTRLYADVVLAVLPEAARKELEAMMVSGTYEYKSDFARNYFSQGMTQGKAEGEASAILSVLSARGIAVPDDAWERISTCRDLEQLEIWIRRAVTVDSVEELFE